MTKDLKNKIIITFVTAVIFFVTITIFRLILPVFPITEVRPAAALNPTLSILYGPWAAVGCAVGNFAADLVNGYGLALAAASFPAQLLYGILPYYLYKYLTGNEEYPCVLDKCSKLLKFFIAAAVSSAVVALLIGCVTEFFGYSKIISQSTLFIFLNDLDFCIVIGCPVMIIVSRYREKKKRGIYDLTLNELLISLGVVSGVLLSAVIAVLAYVWLKDSGISNFLFWGRIFVAVTIVLNVYFLIMFIMLRSTETWFETNRSPIEIDIKKDGDTICVSLSGRIMDDAAGGMYKKISAYLPYVNTVVFDLKELTYISSQGIQTLFKLKDEAPENCAFRIENPNDTIKTLLKMSGISIKEQG